MEDAAAEPGPSHFHAFTTDGQRWDKLKGFARANRRAPTKAEDALWQALRGNKLGPRFRQQHAIASYIVDFVCLPAWLIVEVDGEYHTDEPQAEYDGGRTHELQEMSFCVLRFTNQEVLAHLPKVLGNISHHLTILLPSGRPSGSPSPQGEGAGG